MNTILAPFLCLAIGVAGETTYELSVRVKGDLPACRVPIDPEIDFAPFIIEAGAPGVLDPNSIEVLDAATGVPVSFALHEDFRLGPKGRLQWVVDGRSASPPRDFVIRFKTAESRPPLLPRARVPRIGNGDILYYNAGTPRPITLAYLSGLMDITGDGARDIVGVWNYSRRYGEPRSGIVCYPRVGGEDRFAFGPMTRMRFVDKAESTEYKHFSAIYHESAFVDLDRDGLVDVIYCPSNDDRCHFFKNSGRRDGGGMPVFVSAGDFGRGTKDWQPCRFVDLSGDCVLDMVVGTLYLKNVNPKQWPVEFAGPVPVEIGQNADFFDVDGDGLLDAVGCIQFGIAGAEQNEGERLDPPVLEPGLAGGPVVWRKNLGGDPPGFGRPRRADGLDAFRASSVVAVREGDVRGVLVVHDVFQHVTFFEHYTDASGRPGFRRFGRAESLEAPIALSDQAWPYLCDWDCDGDKDILVGCGYGWPQIVLNTGTDDEPAYAEADKVYAGGKPVRLVRHVLLGGEHWHNMGYSYPTFVDWDGDGLNDLMLPNETNRIYWYKNEGTKQAPVFGERRQLLVDGYPDGPDHLAASVKAAEDQDSAYPREETRPFYWRMQAAFADFNGDGLMDLMTADCAHRRATLFVQYRDGEGNLRLKKGEPLALPDGRPIDEKMVDGIATGWGESYSAVDWEGDGLLDLVFTKSGMPPGGSIFLLRNIGTKEFPRFDVPRVMRCFGTPIQVAAHGPHPYVGDVDNDGKPDILAGVEWSVYPFFAHAAVEMDERPEYEVVLRRSGHSE